MTKTKKKKCGPSIKGKLSVLFRTKWLSLKHLNLKGCNLDANDVCHLYSSSGSQDESLLHRLESLVLSLSEEGDDRGHLIFPFKVLFENSFGKRKRNLESPLKHVFRNKFPNLTRLRLHDTNKEQYKLFVFGLNRGLLPKLSDLSLLMWGHVDVHKNVRFVLDTEEETTSGATVAVFLAANGIEYLDPVNSRKVRYLTLQRFICSAQHLYMVTKSKILTQLTKLDISRSTGMSIFLCHSFPSLDTLILSDCGLNSQNLSSWAKACTKNRLPLLKHLSLSQNEQIMSLERLFSFKAQWDQLLHFEFVQQTFGYSHKHCKILTEERRSSCYVSYVNYQLA